MKNFIVAVGIVMFSLSSQAADWTKTATDLMNSGSETKSATSNAAIDYAKGLIPALESSVGVTGDQAQAGSGALFDLVQSNLNDTDFEALKGMVPDLDIDKLIAAAPAVADSSSSLTSMLGESGDSIAAGQQVYEQFKSLGLTTDQISEYVNVIQGYMQSEGGSAAVGLFKKGLASLAGSPA